MNTITVTILIAFLTAILGPIIVEWIKVKFITKENRDVVGESININEKIDTQLELLLEEFLFP